jgi:hypothetical protein
MNLNFSRHDLEDGISSFRGTLPGVPLAFDSCLIQDQCAASTKSCRSRS